MLSGQNFFATAPTPLDGVVYVNRTGTGDTVYAVRESDGTVLWGSLLDDGESSPAVTSDGVYVSGTCFTDKLDPSNGQRVWENNYNCEGGFGATGIVYQGLVYALSPYRYSTAGITLNASNGSYISSFNSMYSPAFWQNTVFYTQPEFLVAVNIPTSQPLWVAFLQDGDNYSCAPIVVNGVLYAGTSGGYLYGYSVENGSQVFSANLGASISCPDENNPSSLTGMTAGAGLLLVPAGGRLVAFQFDNFGAWQFTPVTPCRLVDTRQGQPIQGGTSLNFNIPQLGGCNIPSNATAYSLNVTAAPHGSLGYLTIWPSGETQPYVSTMNSPDGRIKANAAIVPAGYQDDVSVYASDTTDIILDINGYFAPPASGTYQFYTVPPCRIVDTRGSNGSLGGPYLQGRQSRDFPLLTSSCIPAGVSPTAYSLNITAVPHPAGQQLGYLTVWPTGKPQPNVSTPNNYTATVVANAAIVPAGTGGDIMVYPSDNTDLLIDINGYFAAPGNGGLSLYPAAPCRVLDTRQNNGQPFQGELTVNVAGSACAPPSTAQAYVFNATVAPTSPLGYLTLWPDGQPQPMVSTLNASDKAVTSNMAIVPNQNGSIDAFASNPTYLILDISGYFAP